MNQKRGAKKLKPPTKSFEEDMHRTAWHSEELVPADRLTRFPTFCKNAISGNTLTGQLKNGYHKSKRHRDTRRKGEMTERRKPVRIYLVVNPRFTIPTRGEDNEWKGSSRATIGWMV
jgi:hypothetical protein